MPQGNLTKKVWNQQGMTPIAKFAIAISILVKFEITIAIRKKIADRDCSFAIADRDQYTYC